MQFDRGFREKLYILLSHDLDFLMSSSGLKVMDKAWKLRSLTSNDSRFKDAYGDFNQHIVMNKDWSDYQLLVERLDIYNVPDHTISEFIEAYVSPEFREDETDILRTVSFLNEILSEEVLSLQRVDYFEGRPVFRLATMGSIVMPASVEANPLPIYRLHPEPPQQKFPSFGLRYNNWDDYGFKSTVELFYFEEPGGGTLIGKLKIISEGMDHAIWDVIPEEFTHLSETFCSLGDDIDYYLRLKERFPFTYASILFALRDMAMFPSIGERFEHRRSFSHSLLRENRHEQIARTARFILNGTDYEEALKFRYFFIPPYAEHKEGIDLDFNFVYGENDEIHHRIYALIGKNGAGKTRILAGLANELGVRNSNFIGPGRPPFGKVFTISFSIFDQFQLPVGDADYNYVYCGLKKNAKEHYTREELQQRLLFAAEIISRRNLTKSWHNLLGNYINPAVLDFFFSVDSLTEEIKFWPLDFGKALSMLSSGQHILTYVLTEMLAHIRYNSLILFDEPETHLHPNAISELMNSLFALVKEFNSFCILGTHSPIITQCLQSRNVYIVSREQNQINLRLMEKESFGENLTVITEEIFGTREVEKDYLKLLLELKEEGHSYEQIIALLTRDNQLAPTLNIRLYLKTLFA